MLLCFFFFLVLKKDILNQYLGYCRVKFRCGDTKMCITCITHVGY